MKRGGRAAQLKSGRSSGVEHNLAKVGVEGSNPFARSSISSKCANPRIPGRRSGASADARGSNPFARSRLFASLIDGPGARRHADPVMTKSAAQRLMERETRVRPGPVDLDRFGYRLEPGRSHLEADSFLLHTPDGLSYFYRKGEGITLCRDGAADPSEEQLWLNGSVYSAVACINGLVPIHASAVAHDGRVFAFTGPSGSGKSTLIAALGRRGLPMFCDDTLILDLGDPDRIICLPGHKRLKLTREALALTGAEREEKVGADMDKYYARAPAGDVITPLPLAELIFLERGRQAAIEHLSGAERFVRTQDDHYTSQLFAAARRFDRADQFEHRARLARQIAMYRFVRPWDPARLDEGVALVARHIGAGKGR